MKFRFGTQLLTCYFAIFYIIPAVLSFFFGFHKNFVAPNLSLHTALLALIFFGVWILFYTLFALSFSRGIDIRIPNVFRMQRGWLAVSVISTVIGVYFFVNFGLEYRQTGDRLSNSGVVVPIVYLIKPLVFGYVIYTFLNKGADSDKLKYEKIILILFLAFWVLTVTSSFEFLLLGLLVLYLLSKHIFNRLFYSGIGLKRYSDLRNLILITIAAPLLAFGIIFVGIANKTGISNALPYIFEGDGLSRTAYYLYYRLSLFYHAFLYFADMHLLDWELYGKSYGILYDSWTYRLSLILGLDSIRPELTNLNRLVYELLFYSPKDKEIGASPGFIASFMMVLPAYIAVIISGVYIAVLHHILNCAGSRLTKFSPVAILLVIYFLFPFLHNPINSFLSIGPEVYKSVFYLYVLLVLCNSAPSQGKRNG